MEFVVDKSLVKLRSQINAMAPRRSKRSDGTIGDPAHAAGNSDHNPQHTADSSDGNDPDNEVDALDITHDPARGCDVGQLWEDIRVSRDNRVLYAIFDKRIFSSYSTPSRQAWEWGPYNGDDPHDKHGHLSTNDKHNDDPRDWKINMPLTDKHLTAIMWTDERVEALLLMLAKTRSGNVNKFAEFLESLRALAVANDAATKRLVDEIETIHEKVDVLLARDDTPGVIDYEKLATLIISKIDNEEIAQEIVDEIKAWATRP